MASDVTVMSHCWRLDIGARTLLGLFELELYFEHLFMHYGYFVVISLNFELNHVHACVIQTHEFDERVKL